MKVAGCLLVICLAQALAGCGPLPQQAEVDVRRDRLAALEERAQRALSRDEIERAAILYREMLRMAESVEDFRAIGTSTINLAAVLQVLGRLGEADAALERVLASSERFEPQIAIEAAGRRALLALESGRLDAAAEWLGRAELDCVPPECRIRVALLNLRARLMLERGAAAQVRAFMPQVLGAARTEGKREEVANALRVDGLAAARMGSYPQALASLEAALDLDKRLALPDKIALDLTALAETALASGDHRAAGDYARRALAVAGASGSAVQRAAAHRLLELVP